MDATKAEGRRMGNEKMKMENETSLIKSIEASSDHLLVCDIYEITVTSMTLEVTEASEHCKFSSCSTTLIRTWK